MKRRVEGLGRYDDFFSLYFIQSWWFGARWRLAPEPFCPPPARAHWTVSQPSAPTAAAAGTHLSFKMLLETFTRWQLWLWEQLVIPWFRHLVVYFVWLRIRSLNYFLGLGEVLVCLSSHTMVYSIALKYARSGGASLWCILVWFGAVSEVFLVVLFVSNWS